MKAYFSYKKINKNKNKKKVKNKLCTYIYIYMLYSIYIEKKGSIRKEWKISIYFILYSGYSNYWYKSFWWCVHIFFLYTSFLLQQFQLKNEGQGETGTRGLRGAMKIGEGGLKEPEKWWQNNSFFLYFLCSPARSTRVHTPWSMQALHRQVH